MRQIIPRLTPPLHPSYFKSHSAPPSERQEYIPQMYRAPVPTKLPLHKLGITEFPTQQSWNSMLECTCTNHGCGSESIVKGKRKRPANNCCGQEQSSEGTDQNFENEKCLCMCEELRKGLVELDLSKNKLRQILPSISRFENLRSLSLDFNRTLKTISLSIFTLPLNFLSIQGCAISSLPNITSSTSYPSTSTLTYLNLSNNELDSVPTLLSWFAALRFLKLKSNKIQMVPSFLEKLQSLQSLNLGENPIKSVALNFGVLKELVYLNLSKLELNEIPYQIGELEKLEKLYLFKCGGKNEFRQLPFDISKFQNLRVLDIQVPGLRKLPDGLDCCQRLEKLYLPITTAPLHTTLSASFLPLDSISSPPVCPGDFSCRFGAAQNLRQVTISYHPDIFDWAREFISSFQGQSDSGRSSYASLCGDSKEGTRSGGQRRRRVLRKFTRNFSLESLRSNIFKISRS
ncbi:hypothetical protein BKA69DRAFT_1123405 [Paraphysoderma sedebokerense]|nr:hypothetical protein BKA69DRAFT_1123405 [Paraphysoderma sedebokerense]